MANLRKLLGLGKRLVNLLREVLVRLDDLIVGHRGEVWGYLIGRLGGCVECMGVARGTEEGAEV